MSDIAKSEIPISLQGPDIWKNQLSIKRKRRKRTSLCAPSSWPSCGQLIIASILKACISTVARHGENDAQPQQCVTAELRLVKIFKLPMRMNKQSREKLWNIAFTICLIDLLFQMTQLCQSNTRHSSGILRPTEKILLAATPRQSRISRTPYPPIGGYRGPKIQSRHHLSPKESFDPPNGLSSTGNQWSWGPFERKALLHYSCFGPLWK